MTGTPDNIASRLHRRKSLWASVRRSIQAGLCITGTCASTSSSSSSSNSALT